MTSTAQTGLHVTGNGIPSNVGRSACNGRMLLKL
jgi:hypothetical protein